MAVPTATTNARIDNSRVAANFSLTASATGWLIVFEKPHSKVIIFRKYVTYWTRSGSSRLCLILRAAACSSVVFSVMYGASGSPIMCEREKVIRVTPSRTGMVKAKRLTT